MLKRTSARYLARTWVVVALFIVAPFLIAQLTLALDLRYYDPDTLRLYGYFRYYDPALFPDDYTADYLLSQWEPLGYKAMQYVWARLADPLILHRWLLIVLWAACLPAVYMSARKLGGIANAYATLLIYACSSIFIFRMTGAMSHSFGFSLMWWAVAMVLTGRVMGLAIVTALSAAFYPIITPMAGLMLASLLLCPSWAPAITTKAQSWDWRKKLCFLAATAGLSILWVLPMVYNQASMAYGRGLHIPADINAFPELRNPLATINPFLYVVIAYVLQHSVRIGLEYGQMLTLGLLVTLLISLLFHDQRDRRPQGLKYVFYPTLAIFCASLFLNYDNAYRFAIYSFPILITLILPLALRRICRGIIPKPCKAFCFGIAILIYSACIAGVDPKASGYLFELQDFQTHALDYIATLPKDTMTAGWPGDRSGRIAEVVAYVARRKTLITWAGHGLSHEQYVLTMRERMNALTDAYLAQDIGPILALRDRHHVDYLIVNEADFTGNKPPYYIPPFTERAAALWQANPAKDFMVLRLAKTISVYSRDGIAILDLHQL